MTRVLIEIKKLRTQVIVAEHQLYASTRLLKDISNSPFCYSYQVREVQTMVRVHKQELCVAKENLEKAQ